MSGNDPIVQYFDTDEAARYLSLGKSTLAKHRCYGTGPTYQKIGRRVLYRAADLDAWAATKRRTSTSQITGRADAAVL
ncbi:MAG: helix-turn-helix domain-containing protein [Sphingopyxis sp.]|jgi:excisionase family DNA binding protein|uniref:helix-turn-helix transcriptional regulator n=1 Tax=Sphingopyxis sp. TaxID=1908224 RepID=UPI001A4310F5|nr:helix-turn-helix domain-containing protein [Sphingopyxis sp.]MBL9070510.1 helix-turn-helix domain-containing protein [Sphingopyxis sp.]